MATLGLQHLGCNTSRLQARLRCPGSRILKTRQPVAAAYNNADQRGESPEACYEHRLPKNAEVDERVVNVDDDAPVRGRLYAAGSRLAVPQGRVPLFWRSSLPMFHLPCYLHCKPRHIGRKALRVVRAVPPGRESLGTGSTATQEKSVRPGPREGSSSAREAGPALPPRPTSLRSPGSPKSTRPPRRPFLEPPGPPGPPERKMGPLERALGYVVATGGVYGTAAVVLAWLAHISPFGNFHYDRHDILVAVLIFLPVYIADGLILLPEWESEGGAEKLVRPDGPITPVFRPTQTPVTPPKTPNTNSNRTTEASSSNQRMNASAADITKAAATGDTLTPTNPTTSSTSDNDPHNTTTSNQASTTSSTDSAPVNTTVRTSNNTTASNNGTEQLRTSDTTQRHASGNFAERTANNLADDLAAPTPKLPAPAAPQLPTPPLANPIPASSWGIAPLPDPTPSWNFLSAFRIALQRSQDSYLQLNLGAELPEYLELMVILIGVLGQEMLYRGVVFTLLSWWLRDRFYEAGADDYWLVSDSLSLSMDDTGKWSAVGVFALAGAALVARKMWEASRRNRLLVIPITAKGKEAANTLTSAGGDKGTTRFMHVAPRISQTLVLTQLIKGGRDLLESVASCTSFLVTGNLAATYAATVLAEVSFSYMQRQGQRRYKRKANRYYRKLSSALARARKSMDESATTGTTGTTPLHTVGTNQEGQPPATSASLQTSDNTHGPNLSQHPSSSVPDNDASSSLDHIASSSSVSDSSVSESDASSSSVSDSDASRSSSAALDSTGNFMDNNVMSSSESDSTSSSSASESSVDGSVSELNMAASATTTASSSEHSTDGPSPSSVLKEVARENLADSSGLQSGCTPSSSFDCDGKSKGLDVASSSSAFSSASLSSSSSSSSSLSSSSSEVDDEGGTPRLHNQAELRLDRGQAGSVDTAVGQTYENGVGARLGSSMGRSLDEGAGESFDTAAGRTLEDASELVGEADLKLLADGFAESLRSDEEVVVNQNGR